MGSSDEKNSPKRATRAGTKTKRKTTNPRAPRGLRAQRLAAEVARRVPHLGEGRHIGAFVDVIVRTLGVAVQDATAADVLGIAETGGDGRPWTAASARSVLAWLAGRFRAGRHRGALTAAERAATAVAEREERAARRAAERVAEAERHATVTGEGIAAVRAALAAVQARRRYTAVVPA